MRLVFCVLTQISDLSPDLLYYIDWTEELGPGDAAVLASMNTKHLDGELH